MAELLVFDPALCCSTGICGPEVDPALVRFAADLEWLGKQGVVVRRFNLAQEPAAFAQNALVRRTLQQEGTDCLPLLTLDGQIVSRGRYPAREELAAWGEVGAVAAGSVEGSGPRPEANVSSAIPASEAADSCCAPPLVGLGRSPVRRGPSSGCC